MVSPIFAACVAEACACIIRVPIDQIKMRMQVSSVSGTSSLPASAWSLGGLYRGFSAAIARDIPFACIQMALFETLKTYGVSALIGGSLAGAAAAFLTTPLDMLKTRRQLSLSTAPTGGSKRLARLETLFAGAVPRTCAIGIGGGIFFGAYDVFWKLLGRLPS